MGYVIAFFAAMGWFAAIAEGVFERDWPRVTFGYAAVMSGLIAAWLLA